jgi:catechol 2,3-dioxygenase-like lactoylglutathione lyase family enzyme
MKVTRVMHISVNVPGTLDETRRFYADVLGLNEADRPDLGIGGAWEWIDDSAQLHLIDCEPGDGQHINPAGPHYCVGVDDLDGALAEFDAKGIEYVQLGEGSGRQVWIRDPAGNVIEFQEDAASV